MMEVGNVLGIDGALDVNWNRAHFGAWCIVSSPLILGLDLDSPNLAEVVPFITNPEAVSVNQQWAGSPGFLLSSTTSLQPNSFDPPPANHSPTDALGFVRYAGKLNDRSDTPRGPPLRVANETVLAAEQWCNATAQCACFTRENGSVSEPLPTRFEGGYFGRLLCASNGIHVRDSDPQWSTWVRSSLAPHDAEHGAQQVWAKPQPNGAWAFFLVNSDDSRPMEPTRIDLASLPHFGDVLDDGSKEFAVRDVWKMAPAPELAPVAGIFTPPSVPPRDSAFYLVVPSNSSAVVVGEGHLRAL